MSPLLVNEAQIGSPMFPVIVSGNTISPLIVSEAKIGSPISLVIVSEAHICSPCLQ